MPTTAIPDALDSGSLRAGGYVVAAALPMVRFVIEQRRPPPRPTSSWPVYWLLTALLVGFLGAARSTSLGGLVADFGREQARWEGWYEVRQTVQALAVVAVATAWTIAVAVTIRRQPSRRRYLPNVVAVSALVAFAAIRLVSLHQIDTLLYRRGVGDVRFVAIIELLLLVATIGTIALVPGLTHDVDSHRSESSRAIGRE